MMDATDARKGFLTMIADTSSQVSEMSAGIIAKNIGDKVEIGAFGSIEGVISISGNMFLANLKVALDKAKAEKDLDTVFMLFNQIVNMTDNLKGFMVELDKTTDEIKASMMGGK
jgi:hypothetical protein